MTKVINSESLSDTLELTLCNDGWWLYDETRGMNLAMGETSRDAAFLEALEYYQTRVKEVEEKHKELQKKVESFLCQFKPEDEEFPFL